MRLTNDLGLVLLGIWLVLAGLVALAGGSAGLGIVLALLAIAAGAVLLLGGSSARARNRNPGFLLLAIFLLVRGLMSVVPIRVTDLSIILDLIAIGAGVFLLVGARGRDLSRYPGMLLLSLWLIAAGLVGLLPVGIPGSGVFLALLSAAAGVFILLGR